MTPVELLREPAPAGRAERAPAERGDAGRGDAGRGDAGRGDATVRRARAADVAGIVALVDAWAAEGLLLPRSAADVTGALDDYVVAVDGRGAVLACAALREYSPSLAELVSVAVSRRAQGLGLGRRLSS